MPLSRALTRLQASGLAKSITRIEVTQQLHFTHTIRPAWWWRATLHLFHPWGCALDHRVRQRSSYHLLGGRHWVTEHFLSLPPGRGTVWRQQSLLRQPYIHSVEPENSSIHRIFPTISVTLSAFWANVTCLWQFSDFTSPWYVFFYITLHVHYIS